MTTRRPAMAGLVRRTRRVGGIVCGLLILASLARGETWPPLEEYVQRSVLITKARATVLPPSSPNAPVMVELHMLEVWKGHVEADTFGSDCMHPGVYRASLGEHGLHVVDGQEVILFFTGFNQPDPNALRHSTAFPIRGGKLIYAISSGEYYQEYTAEEFEKAVRSIEDRDRGQPRPEPAAPPRVEPPKGAPAYSLGREPRVEGAPLISKPPEGATAQVSRSVVPAGTWSLLSPRGSK